jgi:hypothetical protein
MGNESCRNAAGVGKRVVLAPFEDRSCRFRDIAGVPPTVQLEILSQDQIVAGQ